MDSNLNRRKTRELVVSLSPPSASASSSNTPRALLRSLVRFPKYCIRKGWKGGDHDDDDDDGDSGGPTVLEEDPIPLSPLMKQEEVVCEERSEEQVAVSSGRKPETVSFNLGVGASLVFLLVKSASEFNKMIELRKQMEILLKDMKGEMQRKNVTPSYSELNNYTVISASNCWGDESASNPISLQNSAYHLAGDHNGMEFDTNCVCETTLEKKRCLKLNQLEEELEAELERLQIKGEDSSVLPFPQQQSMKLETVNINDSESFSASFVEAVNEPKQKDIREHGGVCPRELERRLRELIESRHQERIAELETALECAERKLQEKETEICWWRDTARLVSKHKEVTLFR